MTTIAAPLDSFPVILSRAWRWTRRAVWIAATIAGALIVLEIWRVLDTLAAIHPWLAVAVAVVVGVPLLAWTARAAWRYGRVPAVTAPPDLPAIELGWNERDRARFRRFAIAWLERQAINPHLPASDKSSIPEAIADIRRPLTPEEKPDTAAAAQALHDRAHAWIDRIVMPLDREADRQIRVAAVHVAAATAISPSVLMDSLITLARNLDLMARLADLYYGRPGLLGTVRVARDVLGTAVAAGALEVITDHVTGTISEMTGSLASRWLGPIGQGAVNGVLTIRIGNAARRRCRSLASRRPRWSIPTGADLRRDWRRLFGWIREDLGPTFAGPFARWSDSTDGGQPQDDDAPERRGFLGRLFGRREDPPPTRGTSDVEGPAPEPDPGVECDDDDR